MPRKFLYIKSRSQPRAILCVDKSRSYAPPSDKKTSDKKTSTTLVADLGGGKVVYHDHHRPAGVRASIAWPGTSPPTHALPLTLAKRILMPQIIIFGEKKRVFFVKYVSHSGPSKPRSALGSVTSACRAASESRATSHRSSWVQVLANFKMDVKSVSKVSNYEIIKIL